MKYLCYAIKSQKIKPSQKVSANKNGFYDIVEANSVLRAREDSKSRPSDP